MFLDEVPADSVIARLVRYRLGEGVVGGQGDLFNVDEDEVCAFGLDVLPLCRRLACMYVSKPKKQKNKKKTRMTLHAKKVQCGRKRGAILTGNPKRSRTSQTKATFALTCFIFSSQNPRASASAKPVAAASCTGPAVV